MNNSKLNVVLHRDGDTSPVTLDQDKCLIRTVRDSEKIDCCAIFNGPYGTALRSYTDNVLVNGEPTAARWLNVGDQIQLPCSTRIEVKAATAFRPAMPLTSLEPQVVEANEQAVEMPAVEMPVADNASVPESVLSNLKAVETILAPDVQEQGSFANASEVPVVPVVKAPIVAVEEEVFHSPLSQDAPSQEAPAVPVESTAEHEVTSGELESI